MQAASHQLRIQIERQLADRIPAALTPAQHQVRTALPLSIEEVQALTGGLPLGAVTEVTGYPGSGRTAFASAAVAQTTRAGHVAAWVDTSNALDPFSAAASGILLDRLLWVRCLAATTPPPLSPQTSAIAQPARDSFPASHMERVQHGGGSPHPRSEERGLPEAVSTLLTTPPVYRRDRIAGTPGAPNRPLMLSSAPRHRLSLRIEQSGTDRQPSRRGDYVLQQRELFTSPVSHAPAAPSQPRRTSSSTPWQRMDQALRITDLLLQAGGFQIVVLDLADIAAEHVTRVPLATWFRFRAAAEHAQSALLVLTQHPCTGSSSALLLRQECQGTLDASTCFPGLRFTASVARQRFTTQPPPSVIPMRKPPQHAATTTWSARSPWAGAR